MIATPIGYLAVRYPGRWTALIERAAYLAQGAPGIVVALALISLTVQFVPPLYQSLPLLALAYAILFLPLALVSIRAALSQIPRAVRGGRAVLGRERPLGRHPGRPAAGGERPRRRSGDGLHLRVDRIDCDAAPFAGGRATLATEVWANTSSLAFAAAAPFAALILCLSFAFTWLFANRLGKAAFDGWS